MTELYFMTSTGDDERTISCDYNDTLKTVFKKYAKEIYKDFKQLIFFYDGERLNKKLTVKQYKTKMQKPNEDYILVKIMDIAIESDSDDEKESTSLRQTIIDEIKDINKTPTYEKVQELIVQYGYDMEKKIEKEIKKNPQNFIGVQEAVKKENSNEKLFILGKLGESLENMGIKVVIDKREDSNDDEYIINNQFISSGIIKKNKYEIHIEENDNEKKYQILNNKTKQQKFIEEWKETISNYVSIPKKDIFITNIREGSLKFDMIVKNSELQNLKENYLNINEKMENFANSHPKILSIFVKNILGACKLTLNMLDSRGNQTQNGWAKPGEERGGKEYFPPDNTWIGYGLRVLDQYDNKNNDWIGMNGNPNEWAVAYHGTSENAVKPICSQNGKFWSTIKEGAYGQKCCDYRNINELSQSEFPKCGEGTYCSPHLNYATKYSKGVIIMCRVNPKLMRIPEGKFSNVEWITDGTRNTIRPYRLLYQINN